MKILILGGHGFIGTHVTRLLIDQGHQVLVIDSHDNYGNYPRKEYEFVIGQRCEYLNSGPYDFILSPMERIDYTNLERCDIVINLGTCPDSRYVDRDPVRFHDNFVYQNLRLLDWCSRNNSRFIYISSSMVYGDFTAPAREIDQCHPTNVYGTYKLMVEHLCHNYGRNNGLDYTIIRPSAVYGPRDVIVRVISKFTRDAVTTGKITVTDPGAIVDFTHVSDTAGYVAQLSTMSDISGQTFNASRGRGRTLLEAAEIVQKYLGSCSIETIEGDGFYPKRFGLDMSKTIDITGMNPRWDIEQGIPDYLDWFCANQSNILDK